MSGRKELEARQLQALRTLITRILPSNAFYQRKLEGAGLDGGPRSLAQFFESAPFTSKQELVDDQAANPPYGTNLTHPLEQYTRYNQTSGTTGAPLRWLDTPESWAWMVENWRQVFLASGVSGSDRILFAFSFGPFLGFWTAFEAGASLGCLCLPGGGLSSEGRLALIADNRATVLCCTPTYAIRLGEAAAEAGCRDAVESIRLIVAAGEPGASIPATRRRILALWPNACLKDHHGMTEVGPVSFECPAREGALHILESAFIPEVLDPNTLEPVAPGEQGELVLTNLGRIGSPLLRYRTGDLVRRSATSACPCGRHDLALEGGILGRTDDMVIIRGVNLYPSAVEAVLRQFDAVAEYRVELCTAGAMAEAILTVEPVYGCADADDLRRRIEAAMRATFDLRVPVAIAQPGTLPRFDMKARRWVRLEESGSG